MISKEEIKAKRAATVKRNKEEDERKKAAGIDTCRGCNREFQKIDPNVSATCSWECALSATQTGRNWMPQVGYIIDNGKCWTNDFRETIIHERTERPLKDVADELYCKEWAIDLNDNCDTFGCNRMIRECVNWHHFKKYSDLEFLLHDSKIEDIDFFLEKMIKNSKDIIVEILSYTYGQEKSLGDRFEEIEVENKKIKECREILEVVRTRR